MGTGKSCKLGQPLEVLLVLVVGLGSLGSLVSLDSLRSRAVGEFLMVSWLLEVCVAVETPRFLLSYPRKILLSPRR